MVYLYIYSAAHFPVAESIRATVMRPHLFNSLFLRFKGHSSQGLVTKKAGNDADFIEI